MCKFPAPKTLKSWRPNFLSHLILWSNQWPHVYLTLNSRHTEYEEGVSTFIIVKQLAGKRKKRKNNKRKKKLIYISWSTMPTVFFFNFKLENKAFISIHFYHNNISCQSINIYFIGYWMRSPWSVEAGRPQ